MEPAEARYFDRGPRIHPTRSDDAACAFGDGADPGSLSRMDVQRLGPDDGRLEVRTFREGLAQRVGHDLVIEVSSWKATLEADPDGTLAGVRLEADPRSLEVREGRNGVKPLTAGDRRDIQRTIDSTVLCGMPIEFASSEVRPRVGGATVRGELTLAGATRPLDFEVTLAQRLSSTVSLRQSDWGIEPYRAFMGALRVRDDVEVELDAGLPGGGSQPGG